MRMIMIWFAISTLFSSIGLEALRRANIPVPLAVMDRLQLLILLPPGCSVVYALISLMLVEVHDADIKESSIYKDISKSLENGFNKRLSISTICAAVLHYLGFSFNNIWISSILSAVWILLCDVKADWFVSNSPLFWLLVSPILCFPEAFIASIVNLIPRLHLLIVSPYFESLISTSSTAARAYGQRRYLEIVFGMLANAVAAYYTRLQSVHLMLAFLSFAIASLGIFANVNPCTDFGVIQFLVTSSIQCAVGLFGLLHVYTFAVLLVGFGVMVLRWKMELEWGKKLWPYLIKTEGAAAYLCAMLVILLVFFFRASGNTRHLMLLSSNAVYITLIRRKLFSIEHSAAREEIFANVSNWKWWHGVCHSANPSNLFFYIHFREILRQFMQHMCRRHSCRLTNHIPPV